MKHEKEYPPRFSNNLKYTLKRILKQQCIYEYE